MKRFNLVAALIALAACLSPLAPTALAQQPPHHGAPLVAILDLTYIFKNHTRFQQMSNDMRREVEAAENSLKSDRESYQQLTQKLEQYKRGTPEYRALEEELAKRAAELNLQVNIQKKNFLEQEAKIYYTVYQEVIDCVKYHCDTTGVALVLRFNGDPIDRNDPQEVLKELNKSVIYYNRSIDITPIILEKLNAVQPRQGYTGGAVPPQTQQNLQQAQPQGLPRR
ncbi:MAG TPA: OmpH family outer membrane protein [Pirellulales bacterium]|nr:OmpH family outer membrane protein [Pirellulales bacterium]